MKKQRIYISGPMSGLDRKDYLLNFAAAQVTLEACGYEVVNPCRLPPCRWPWLYRLIGYRKTLAWDLAALRTCGGIYMMQGWQHSRGARLEHRKAKEYGITIKYESV